MESIVSCIIRSIMVLAGLFLIIGPFILHNREPKPHEVPVWANYCSSIFMGLVILGTCWYVSNINQEFKIHEPVIIRGTKVEGTVTHFNIFHDTLPYTVRFYNSLGGVEYGRYGESELQHMICERD